MDGLHVIRAATNPCITNPTMQRTTDSLQLDSPLSPIREERVIREYVTTNPVTIESVVRHQVGKRSSPQHTFSTSALYTATQNRQQRVRAEDGVVNTRDYERLSQPTHPGGEICSTIEHHYTWHPTKKNSSTCTNC